MLADQDQGDRVGVRVIACSKRDRLGHQFSAVKLVLEHHIVAAGGGGSGVERLVEGQLETNQPVALRRLCRVWPTTVVWNKSSTPSTVGGFSTTGSVIGPPAPPSGRREHGRPL